MALKGSLHDFGISEIMQMIGHQHKSGVLTVREKGSEVNILFHEGNIVSARAEPLPEELEWGELLVRSGLISRSQFELVEKMSRESLQSLEFVLVKTKTLSEDELKEVIKLRNLEITNSLFLLNTGEYEFVPGSVSYFAQLTIPISSEQVLMDGYRIKDEWPHISREVPSMEMRFAKKGGEFSVADRLPEDENRIYRMIDGEHTVRDMIFLSRMGKFEVCRILARLSERDRIQPVSEAEPPRPSVAPGHKRLFQAFFYPAFVILTLLLINGIRINLVREKAAPYSRYLQQRYQIQRIEQALEAYRLAFGNYPRQLDDLVQEKFLGQDEISFPWKSEGSGGHEYDYQKHGNLYILRSPVLRSRTTTKDEPPSPSKKEHR